MTCKEINSDFKFTAPISALKSPVAKHKRRLWRSAPVGSPRPNTPTIWPRTTPGGNPTVTQSPSVWLQKRTGRGLRGLAGKGARGTVAVLGHSRAGHGDKCWPRGLRGGGPRGARGATSADKERRGPRGPRLPRASSQMGQLRAQGFASPGRPSACLSMVACRFAATGQPCPSAPSERDVGRGRVCAGRCPRCERSPRGGDGRGGGGAAGTRVAAAGGGGGAPGFKKVWRGRALSQARPRGVAHTHTGGGARGADDELPASPAPAPRSRSCGPK